MEFCIHGFLISVHFCLLNRTGSITHTTHTHTHTQSKKLNDGREDVITHVHVHVYCSLNNVEDQALYNYEKVQKYRYTLSHYTLYMSVFFIQILGVFMLYTSITSIPKEIMRTLHCSHTNFRHSM